MASIPNLTICIGASAGGIEAIVRVVSVLPADLQATLIVATHRSPHHRSMLHQIVASRTDMRVAEPVDGEYLTCSRIFVGGGAETVKLDGPLFEVEEDVSNYARLHRIDDLFLSVAESAGENAIGVVLSGALCDGVEGMAAIAAAGGRCIVQNPVDASFSQMPREALARIDADFVGSAESIGRVIADIASGRRCQSVQPPEEPSDGADEGRA